MKAALITFMSTTVGFMVLSAVLGTMLVAGPVSNQSISEMEEISESEYEQLDAVAPKVTDKVTHVRICTPFGQSPGETISSQKELTVDGQSAKFAGFRSSLISGVSKGTVILYVLGGLCIVGGIVVAVWLKRVLLGLAVAGGGIALMAVAVLFERYPWIVLVGAVVLLGGLVWFLYDSWKGGRLSATLKAVVTGVEAAPPEAQAAVKAQIAVAANGNKVVKQEVTKLKT